MKPIDKIPVKPISIKSADDEFEFYFQWSLESRKRTSLFVNEVLRSMMTLSGVMLGGSLTFLSGIRLWCQAMAACCFFIALALSLLGIIPHVAKVPTFQPLVFRREHDKALQRKALLLNFAAAAIYLGFVAVAFGAIIGTPAKPAP